MYLSGFLFIDFLSLMVISLLFLRNVINIERDFLFLFYWLQVYIYIHFAPTIALISLRSGQYNYRVLQNNSDNIEFYYFCISIIFFIFFELPYFYFFLKSRKKTNQVEVLPNRSILINKNFFYFLSILFIIFPLVFLQVSISTELFFKRIGHEAYSNRLASLSLWESLIYKYYYKTGLFILSIFLIVTLKVKGKLSKFIFAVVFLINLIVLGFYDLLNNRLQSIVMIIYLFAIFLFFQNRKRNKIKFPIRKIAMLGIVLFFTVKVVVSLRTGFVENGGEIKAKDFNPFKNDTDENNDPFYWRLNGIDLVARMLPNLLENPIPNIVPYYESFLISYGSIFGAQISIDRKNDLETTIKSQLIKSNFPDANSIDYYSCSLTDLFGCLNIFGLLFYSFFHGTIFSILNYYLLYSKSARKIIFALFLIPYFMVFEYETTVILWGWLKLMPILGLFLLFKIFEIKDIRN